MNHTELDIVLPCYNPPADWAEQVTAAYHAIKARLEMETVGLYIVNDGSNSETVEHGIEAIKAQVPHLQYISYTPNHGKGYALRQGVALTQAQRVIYTDIDFPYDIESFVNVYQALKDYPADVVVGVRPMSYYEQVPRVRRIISKVARFFIRLFLRIPTTDTQAGIKGFNQMGKEVFLSTTIDRYLFDMEFIYLSARRQLSIHCQTVALRPGVKFSHMNWKILATEGLNFLRILFFR